MAVNKYTLRSIQQSYRRVLDVCNRRQRRQRRSQRRFGDSVLGRHVIAARDAAVAWDVEVDSAVPPVGLVVSHIKQHFDLTR